MLLLLNFSYIITGLALTQQQALVSVLVLLITGEGNQACYLIKYKIRLIIISYT